MRLFYLFAVSFLYFFQVPRFGLPAGSTPSPAWFARANAQPNYEQEPTRPPAEPATEEKRSALETALFRGAAHLERNEKDEAVKELRTAVALDPRSAVAHQLLGQACLMSGTYEMLGEAKAEFVQALAINPSLVWSRFYLARIDLDLGFPEKAKQQLELALDARPNVPHLLSLLGEANRKLGNPELALDLNKQAIKADPSFLVAHYYLGLAYLDLGNEAEGVRQVETAVNSGYAIPDLYLTLGALYLQRQNLDGATELFQKAIAVAPGRPEGHLRLAQAYRKRNLLEPALAELAKALPLAEHSLNTEYYQRLQADILFERALAYQQLGATPRAIESYERVLALGQNQGPAHRQLAELFFEQADYQRALQHARAAGELKAPVNPSLFEQIVRKAGSQTAE